jgi:hypothetical protein
MNSLLQKPSVTQAHNIWVIIHIEQSEKSAINIDQSGRWVYVDDGIFRHPHVGGLRHAWLS